MKKLFAAMSGALSTAFVASQVFAANLNPCPPSGSAFSSLCQSVNDPQSTLKNVVILVLVLVVLVALAFLIWGGFKWITSGGDKTKVETARNTIIGAIIGLIIAFLSFFIITIVAGIFGVKPFQDGATIPNVFDSNSGTSGITCPAGQHAVADRGGGQTCINN